MFSASSPPPYNKLAHGLMVKLMIPLNRKFNSIPFWCKKYFFNTKTDKIRYFVNYNKKAIPFNPTTITHSPQQELAHGLMVNPVITNITVIKSLFLLLTYLIILSPHHELARGLMVMQMIPLHRKFHSIPFWCK